MHCDLCEVGRSRAQRHDPEALGVRFIDGCFALPGSGPYSGAFLSTTRVGSLKISLETFQGSERIYDGHDEFRAGTMAKESGMVNFQPEKR